MKKSLEWKKQHISDLKSNKEYLEFKMNTFQNNREHLTEEKKKTSLIIDSPHKANHIQKKIQTG